MSGNAFRKVRPGDPLVIPAAAYNKFIDVAKMQSPGFSEGNRQFRNSDTVLVRPAGDVDQYTVMAVRGVVFEGSETPGDVKTITFQNKTVLKVRRPNPEIDGCGMLVVMAEGVQGGEVGRAFVRTTRAMRIIDQNNAFEYADFGTTTTGAGGEGGGGGSGGGGGEGGEGGSQTTVNQYLTSQGKGRARILWRSDELGEDGSVWAMIDLTNVWGSMNFPARITGASKVSDEGDDGSVERTVGWKYNWKRVVFDSSAKGWTLNGATSCKLKADDFVTPEDDKAGHAFNLYEEHLRQATNNSSDASKWLKVGQCNTELGIAASCPPSKDYPLTVQPIPTKVCIDLHAELTADWKTVWTFNALNPAQFGTGNDGFSFMQPGGASNDEGDGDGGGGGSNES